MIPQFPGEGESAEMRIAVVDIVSVDGGGYQVTNSLYQYIASGNCLEHEWLFIVSNQDFKSNDYVSVVKLYKGSRGYLNRAITELIDVNRALRSFDAQLVIAMSNMKIFGCRINQLVYMQQSIPFQKEKKFSILKCDERKYAFRQYIQGGFIKTSLRKAKGVLVQTHWIEKAIKEIVEDIPVVCIGFPGEDGLTKSKYKAAKVQNDFFYPCGPEVYKNLPVVVSAVQELKDEGYRFSFYLTISEKDLEVLSGKRVDTDTFICMGKVPHERVQELYPKTSLVFASYIETVGLPLVEAKNTGAWIIASDCAFSHEVLDDYPNCVFFDYHSSKELAEQMRQVLSNTLKLEHYDVTSKEPSVCWDRMIQYINVLGIC